jgi:hypothetical protein
LPKSSTSCSYASVIPQPANKPTSTMTMTASTATALGSCRQVVAAAAIVAGARAGIATKPERVRRR